MTSTAEDFRMASLRDVHKKMTGKTYSPPEYDEGLKRMSMWDGNSASLPNDLPPAFWSWYMNGTLEHVLSLVRNMNTTDSDVPQYAWGPLGTISSILGFLPIPGARVAAGALGALNMGVDAITGSRGALEAYSSPQKALTTKYVVQAFDALRGSLGPQIDKMIGKSLGGSGMVLRKMEYSMRVPLCEEFIFTYRRTDQNQGILMTKLASSENSVTQQYFVNADAAGVSDVVYNLKLPHALGPGDLVLGNTIRIDDGRSANAKQGSYTAGILPCKTHVANTSPSDNSGTQLYGMFPAAVGGSLAGPFTGKCIGGVVTRSASVSDGIAVADSVQSESFMVEVDRDTTSGAFKENSAAPIMAIAMDGLSQTPYGLVSVHLTTYALVASKFSDSSPAPPLDETYSLQDFFNHKIVHPVH